MRIKMIVAAVVGAAAWCNTVQAYDLMDIYKEAYLRDPVVQQAKAQRDQAYAAIDEATAELLPQIDVTGSYTGYRTSDSAITGDDSNRRSAQAGVSLSQLIWQHSSWVNRSIAEKTATKTDLAYNDALQKLIIRVSTAYFDVLNASDSLTYNKANYEALKNQLDRAEKQFNVGLIAETDKLEAQAACDLANASVISAQNSLINSYEEIRALIGRPLTVDELSDLNTQRFSTPAVAQTLKTLIRQAEGNNLALQQAAVARDIAKDNITLARTGHEPVVTLDAAASTGYTDYSTQNSSQKDGNAWTQSLGLNVTMPIFHGGATTAKTREAEAAYVEASQALEQEHRNLLSTVTSDYNNVNAAISSVRAYELSVKSADSALKATQAGYEVGTRTMTDVLDATQSLYSAMENAASARYNYILSRLNLRYDGGSLKVQDLEAVNSGLNKR
jgi:outer membrane protein